MRVVLDTNAVISALLFDGTASGLVRHWQGGALTLLVTRPIVEEYLRALAYPKFKLLKAEVRALVEDEILAHAEVVTVTRSLAVVKADPEDDTFLECALQGRGRFVVSGDVHLLALGAHGNVRIVTPGDLLRALQRKP